MAGDAITNKSAILSESAMVSECEQEGGGVSPEMSSGCLLGAGA